MIPGYLLLAAAALSAAIVVAGAVDAHQRSTRVPKGPWR